MNSIHIMGQLMAEQLLIIFKLKDKSGKYIGEENQPTKKQVLGVIEEFRTISAYSELTDQDVADVWILFNAHMERLAEDANAREETEQQEPTYYNKHTLWIAQAPNFNFELDADQLLAKALKVGFVTKVGPDCYELIQDYCRS